MVFLENACHCPVKLLVCRIPRHLRLHFSTQNKITNDLQLGGRKCFDLLDQFGRAHGGKINPFEIPSQCTCFSGKPVVRREKCTYLPRLMPKPIARSKTRKAVAKRFKITGTGKVLRQHASRRHLLSSKSGKLKRHMAKSAVVHETDVARIKLNMPFA